MTEPITVLVVDNEPGLADLVASMLERERDCLVAESLTRPEAALALLDDGGVDCIVSDYEMPELTGLDLLDAVRDSDPELPFILFTGRGSEAVASEAIAAGVTQYVRKGRDEEQYALLANQIVNAVTNYRTEAALRENERRYERTLAALHETTRDLLRAGTKTEIYRTAVETATDVLDVPFVRAYAFEPADGRLEVVATTDDARSAGRADAVARGEGPIWTAFSDGESVYRPDVETDDADPRSFFRSELRVPLGSHGILVAGATSVDGFDESMRELCHILAANTEAALDRAEREALLRDHDRSLTAKNEALTRLNHVNEIARRINHGIAGASARDEIESIVCDRLADTDRYRFAWLASTAADPPRPAAWAGVDATYIDRIREDGAAVPEVATARATLADEQPVVVRDVLDDDRWDDRRTEALTYGFQTVLAIPVTDGDRYYGVLFVHAGGVDSIDEDERAVLAELGEMIGFAIRSVERTRAMVADTRTEIELACPDDRLLLTRLARRLDARLSVQGVVERSDEAIVLFVTVDGPPVTELDAIVAEWATLEAASVHTEHDDGSVLELTVAATPLLEVVGTRDVRLRGVTATPAGADIVLELSRQVDTRTVVESIQTAYPETELRARRERTSAPPAPLDSRLVDRLTDRQLEALKAAHYSGFFEWPRDSTGEELAAALDVSPPTYHYHLRAAERKLVSIALDPDLNN
ncbi:GAF domain-containing protein [Halobacteria archaeon AArc-dxtr1]|nr:GAF domain-containing protein [Halobacteria archaeon AArc-dxtr1]